MPSSPDTSSGPPSGINIYEDRASELLAALWITTAIALIVLVARLYIRLRIIKYKGWDDFFVTISMILGLAGVILETISVRYGFGKHVYVLNPDDVTEASKFNMIAIPPNLMSSATAKISVCFFLIHVNQVKSSAYLLYGMAVLLFLTSSAATIVLLTQCQPVAALWDLEIRLTTGRCLPANINANVGLAQSVFFCLADIVFAIFPLTFLWELKMTRRTKAALGFVLSLGFLAAACGIVRCVELQELTSRADILFSTVDLAIWSFLESNVTIIAACIPVLYTVFRTWLGELTTRIGSSYTSSRIKKSFRTKRDRSGGDSGNGAGVSASTSIGGGVSDSKHGTSSFSSSRGTFPSPTDKKQYTQFDVELDEQGTKVKSILKSKSNPKSQFGHHTQTQAQTWDAHPGTRTDHPVEQVEQVKENDTTAGRISPGSGGAAGGDNENGTTFYETRFSEECDSEENILRSPSPTRTSDQNDTTHQRQRHFGKRFGIVRTTEVMVTRSEVDSRWSGSEPASQPRR